MVRNRSKQDRLASECPQRINKWLDKLAKLERYRKSLREKLKMARALKVPVLESPTDLCEVRIGKIKEALKSLKDELRHLEKELKISRKQSVAFGGKGKRSKVEKLTKVRK